MVNYNSKDTHLKQVSASENSLIVETDQFADGLQFFTDLKKVLILFDIDNTIFSYRHTLGTDQWFDFDFKEFMQGGGTASDALKEVLPFYLKIVPEIHPDDVYAVEPETPETIINLQKKGFNILALTSRGEYLQDETLSQLNRFGINFNQGHFKDRQQRFPFGEESVLYNGMILAGGKDKGDCLLECLDYTPERIVMYDDKLSNLEKVQRAVNELNLKHKNDSNFKPTEFMGIRYSRLDHKIQNVNQEIIELQKKYFKRVLSDSDAGVILKAEAKKDRKTQVKLDFDNMTGRLSLYSHKIALTNLLANIIPDLEKHRVMGKVVQFQGKDKQSFAYEFTKQEAQKTFKILAQHGLVEHSDFEALSPILKSKPAIVHRYNLREKRATGYEPQTCKAVNAPKFR